MPQDSPDAAFAVPLAEPYLQQLTFQRYPEAASIDGVRWQALNKRRAENGFFMEYARLQQGELEPFPGFTARQISVSYAAPERINAFHIHPREAQNELWTVIAGQLLVWLVDCRQHSPSQGVKRAFVLSGEAPVQLYIPAGVAHGYRAGAQGATLLYMMDKQFDLANPNEGRLPWDAFGADLWQEDRG